MTVRVILFIFCWLLFPFDALGGSIGELIKKAEQKFGIPANLLNAVIKFESDHNTTAVNSIKPGVVVPSFGLGQLTYATAKSHCDLGPEKIFEPRANVFCSARVLKYQLDRYNDSVDYALAAYNDGTPCVCDGKFYTRILRRDPEICRKPKSRIPLACTDKEKGRFKNQPYVDSVKVLLGH